MTDYVKSTNFTSKDSLASGNPLKIVKGAEFDTEFNNIATAVATKADIANPTFTGVPSAPSPALSATLTQLATVATVQSLYPVGSIYLNAANATNPATLLGFGTWTAFGAGRMPVGFNAADPLFDTAEEIGGSKDSIAVAHTHTATTTISDPQHSHGFTVVAQSNSTSGTGKVSTGSPDGTSVSAYTGTTASASTGVTASTTVNSAGAAGTNANLPPYITVYMWKRTA